MELNGVWQDLGFMQRWCRRQPGFALTALATLTLGIGACTAIFSVVNAVVLRPVPYPNPDRIVLVGTNTGTSAPLGPGFRASLPISGGPFPECCYRTWSSA